MLDALDVICKRFGESEIGLEQVVGNPGRALCSDSGQARELFDEVGQRIACARHGSGVPEEFRGKIEATGY